MPFWTVPIVNTEDRLYPVYELQSHDLDPLLQFNIPNSEYQQGISYSWLWHLMLLGYVSQIWQKVCYSLGSPIDSPSVMTGEGSMDFSNNSDGWQVSAVLMDLTFIPKDVDVGFGTSELLHAGWCGFMFNAGGYGTLIEKTLERFTPPDSPKASFMRVFQLSGGIGNNQEYHGPLRWINHKRMHLVPESRMATGFWWKLKPGVVGQVQMIGQENKFGARIDNYNFNPLKGGFYTEPTT